MHNGTCTFWGTRALIVSSDSQRDPDALCAPSPKDRKPIGTDNELTITVNALLLEQKLKGGLVVRQLRQSA